ncbi:hypothetical protein PHJA_000079700 [Phtheirospermum japonicum]|uniref:Protein SirB1 N-terminal domain-containing protein n=1 Tax=Phtheirospermum japonicum TaxID=374723 RepID=A0A830B1N5_9LAMI|nr:hypothetical protein PHJA_000079700 [Phtheirospermum japonicum]
MLCVSLPGFSNPQITNMITAGIGSSLGNRSRFDFDVRGKNWSNYQKIQSKNRLSISPLASSALVESLNSSTPNFYKEVIEASRDQFTREISFQSKDKDVSLAKALLYVAAEDEAYLAYNRELDARAIHNEKKDISQLPDAHVWDSVEAMPLAGKNINEWLAELDIIAKEVEAELVPREIGCDLVEVVEAVNKILFESRGFKRLPVLVDSKCSYLHSVLSSGRASAILLSVIYIEVCQRINLMIVGSRVGEEFLIWPQTGNPEELFKVTSGNSLFGVVNGKCVNDPWSVHRSDEKFNENCGPIMPLLRPQELRLAMMASERLLILQPPNWTLRRDLGMMLYYNREYEAAVQELSICMAFAPEDEAEVLEPFVEKLHLMRIETSWTKSLRLANSSLS